MFQSTLPEILKGSLPVLAKMMIETHNHMFGPYPANDIFRQEPVIRHAGELQVEWKDHHVVDPLFFYQGNFFIQ